MLSKTTNSQKQSNSGPLPMQPNKPKRPMSAYNFFFQDEHRRIKDEIEAAEAAEEAAEEAKARAAGEEPPKKEARRKKKISPREKLGFEDLGKFIGRRWKEISEDDLAAYKRRAAEDAERYKLEAEAYYKGQLDAMCMGYNNSKEGEQQGNDVTQVPTKRKRRKKNEDEPSAVMSLPISAGNPGASILPFQLNQTLAGNPMLLQAQLTQFQAPQRQRQLSAYADLIEAQVQMQQHQQNQFAQLMSWQMLQMMQLFQAQQEQQQGGSGTDGSDADGQ